MSLIRVYPQHWFSPRNAQQPEQSFQPLDRLHHDIDRLFNGFFTPGWPTSLMDKPQADIRPSLDIHSDDKAYTTWKCPVWTPMRSRSKSVTAC